MTQLMYAISSSVFAAMCLAITAAMFAAYSQFIAQDDRVRTASVVMAYISFTLGFGSLVSFYVEAFA